MKLSSQVAFLLSSVLVAGQTTLATSGEIDPTIKACLTFLVALSQALLTQTAFNRYPSGEKLFKRDPYNEDTGD